MRPGDRLGPYEVLAKLGEGGMGEVYKARDTRLDRTVAIKVLPAEISGDPDRRVRFEREAKTIAGLNHPHICTLHDVGDHEGAMFLVMEHLTGQTLADRLEKGPLPLGQTLAIATDIADALAAAHRQGVIHRDLKPGNVMLTKAGAKLLDFGLAKLAERGAEPGTGRLEAALTRSASLTGEGVIVGTLPYMAPEQLEGKAPDAGTDLWALGVIVYEMVTGKRAFEGTSAVSLMGSILEREPARISTLRPVTPPALDRLVWRCLQKDPELRWQSAADLAEELRWTAEGLTTASFASSKWWRPTAVLLVVLLVGTVVGWATTLSRWRRTASFPAHVTVSIADQGLTLTSGGVAVSPDGSTLVFAAREGEGQTHLYVRLLDEWQARRLEGTEGAVAPLISPDGAWIAFTAGALLKKVQLTGGTPETLCKTSYQGASRGSWANDGSIVASQYPGLPVRVPSEGGTPRPVASLPASFYLWPHLLPDGNSMLLTALTGSQPRVIALLANGEVRQVFDSAASCARYLPTGHLVYEAQGHLRAMPFDPQRLRALGPSRLVIDDIAVGASFGAAASFDYDVSSTGTMVYTPAATAMSSLVWRDRAGHIVPLNLESRRYGFPSLSPDGRHVTVTVLQGTSRNVWIGSVDGEPLEQLTFDGNSCCSLFSPDGRWVYFGSIGLEGAWGNLFRMLAESRLRQERLLDAPATIQKPTSLSKDGILLFNESRVADDRHIAQVNVNRPGSSVPVGQPASQENEGVFSPDGKWLAYQSDESGVWQVYVKPYPTAGTRGRQVSTDGGMGPVWNPRGGELFYETRTALMSVLVEDGSPKGPPRQLFTHRKSDDHRREFDVAPDGERFLFAEPATPRTEIKVILNWFEELKAKVPAGGAGK